MEIAPRMSTTTTRRGAPRRGEPSARERLVKTVIELFYQEGVRAIGIDMLVARSALVKVFAVSDLCLQGGADCGLCRGTEPAILAVVG